VIFGYEANTTIPANGWVVENIVKLEACAVDIHELVELGLEEDILRVNIRVDERDGGLVKGIFEGRLHNLVHWSKAGAASNHADVADEIRGVGELTFGSLDTNVVPYLEQGHMAGNDSFFVCLDEQLKVATMIIAADRGIASKDFLSINFRSDGYVSADRKT